MTHGRGFSAQWYWQLDRLRATHTCPNALLGRPKSSVVRRRGSVHVTWRGSPIRGGRGPFVQTSVSCIWSATLCVTRRRSTGPRSCVRCGRSTPRRPSKPRKRTAPFWPLDLRVLPRRRLISLMPNRALGSTAPPTGDRPGLGSNRYRCPTGGRALVPSAWRRPPARHGAPSRPPPWLQPRDQR